MSKPVTQALATHMSWALKLPEDQAQKICEYVGLWRDMLDEGTEQFACCESPAERLFLLGFMIPGEPSLSFKWSKETRDTEDKEADFELGFFTCFDRECVLFAQRRISEYRVDFALESPEYEPGDPLWWGVAIEIDGHEFHEKTKAQASSDRERDRHLQLNGYVVIRFTGSDVYRDPKLVSRDAMFFASEVANRIEAAAQAGADEALEKLTAPSGPKQLPAPDAAECAEAAE
jgi:very-short-patch-repair endonuclease